jgi:hypothetical protein
MINKINIAIGYYRGEGEEGGGEREEERVVNKNSFTVNAK